MFETAILFLAEKRSAVWERDAEEDGVPGSAGSQSGEQVGVRGASWDSVSGQICPLDTEDRR